MKIIKTLFIASVFFLFFNPAISYANPPVFNPCIFEVTPTTGDEDTVFEFRAETCALTYPIDPTQTPTYRLVLLGPNNTSAVFCMEGDENWVATLSIPGSGFTVSGNYNAELQWRGYGQSCNQTSNPPGDFLDSVSFTVSVPEELLQCGTIISVPPDPTQPDPCVPGCPITARTDEDGGYLPGWICQRNIVDTASAVSVGCNQGSGWVSTAIGCIPFTIISETARFFLAWGLSVGGGVALLLTSISAIMFATSSGNPEKVKSAKDLFWAALTGLGMLLLSVFLLRFIGVDVLGLFG